MEEEEKVLAQAIRFDELVRLPAWNEVLQYAVDRLNSEIVEATKEPDTEYFADWPERQRIHVLRWNAMREIVDSVRAFVDSARTERDRILQERELDTQYAGHR